MERSIRETWSWGGKGNESATPRTQPPAFLGWSASTSPYSEISVCLCLLFGELFSNPIQDPLMHSRLWGVWFFNAQISTYGRLINDNLFLQHMTESERDIWPNTKCSFQHINPSLDNESLRRFSVKDKILSNYVRVITSRGEHVITHPDIEGTTRQFEYRQAAVGTGVWFCSWKYHFGLSKHADKLK